MSRRTRDIRPLALIAGSGVVGVLGTFAVLSMNAGAPEPTESVETTPSVVLTADIRGSGAEDAEARGSDAAPVRIRVRGSSRGSPDAQPIVYVDGVRVNRIVTDSESSSEALAGGALPGIDPDDIDRVEVLKGPAARRMYGSEAENGVIQVFTKSGSGSDRP